MIDISEGELLDLLPAQLKYDTDMICLSHAIKKEIDGLLEYEKRSMTSNFVDSLPEKILDVLAVEMRSLYYLDTMDIETKREIIKKTYIWHLKAGTAGATSEMIETVFGEGSLVEWYNFEGGEGDPYTFDIVTNAQMTEDVYTLLSSVIERVKNVRSHLRWIKIDRDIRQTEYVAVGAMSDSEVTIGNAAELDGGISFMPYYAAAAVSYPEITIS